MKNCKKLLALLLSLTLAAALVAGFGPTALADYDAVEQAQHSVVRVFSILSMNKYSGEMSLDIGSGFAVGKAGEPVTYIVTNHHVVSGNMSEVYVTTTDIEGGIRARVVDYNEEIDYAILKLERSLTDREPITLLSPRQIHKSQDVYCIGFPGLSDKFTQDNKLSSQIEDMTITKGTVSNPQYDFDGTECVMSDVKANPGNSGGPMVDENGCAVGINTTVIGLDALNNMTLAVSMDYVMQRLDRLGIEYISADNLSADEAQPSEDENSQDDQNGAPEQEDGESKEKVSLNMKTLAIAGTALVVVAAVVIILVLLKKNKRVPVAAETGAAKGSVIPPQNPGRGASGFSGGANAAGRLVVECVRGPILGQRVTGSCIKVGRSIADCDLAFPGDTHGVSRTHCELRAGPNGILLRDLGSSYGTMLSDNRRLPSGGSTVIRSGDVIFLGSEKIAVRVTMLP